MGIELKNINLENVTIEEQISKLLEEVNEFIYAVLKKDATNAPKECLDVFQSAIGVLDKGVNMNADYLMECYPEHLKKIENRPRVKDGYWVRYRRVGKRFKDERLTLHLKIPEAYIEDVIKSMKCSGYDIIEVNEINEEERS